MLWFLTWLNFYLQKLLIWHLLDVMHIERNICENLLKLIFGAKDTTTLHRDMENERIHLWVWLGPIAGRNYFKPPAPYVLTKEEQLDNVSLLMKKHILKNWFGNMKSHDFHNFFQLIFFTCLTHLMHPGPRQAIIRLARLFIVTCIKSHKCSRVRTTKTWCSKDHVLNGVLGFFFDILVHLPIYIVRHVKLCGPIANAWCYPVQRHLNVLKKYIHSKAHPKGAIANAYTYDETLGFCIKYLKLYPHTTKDMGQWGGARRLRVSAERKTSNREVTREKGNLKNS